MLLNTHIETSSGVDTGWLCLPGLVKGSFIPALLVPVLCCEDLPLRHPQRGGESTASGPVNLIRAPCLRRLSNPFCSVRCKRKPVTQKGHKCLRHLFIDGTSKSLCPMLKQIILCPESELKVNGSQHVYLLTC